MDADTEGMEPEGAPDPDPGPTHGRRTFLGLAGGAVVVAGAAVAGWELTRPTHSTTRAAAATTTTPPTTKASSLQVTTETRPPLPIPAALPDPDAPAPPIVVGDHRPSPASA